MEMNIKNIKICFNRHIENLKTLKIFNKLIFFLKHLIFIHLVLFIIKTYKPLNTFNTL